MTDFAKIAFARAGRKPAGTVVILVGEDLALGKGAKALGVGNLVRQAAATAEFKGKPRSTLDLIAPRGTDLDRLLLVGTGKPGELGETDWLRLGGATMGALGKATKATVVLERPDDGDPGKTAAAGFALGVKLRAANNQSVQLDVQINLGASPSTASMVARPFELRRWRLAVELGLWILSFVVLALPLLALVLTSLVPAVGVPLNFATATLDNYRFVLFEHAAAKRALVNSFGLSATAAIVIVLLAIPLAYFLVWRRSRLLRVINLITEMPYALPGVVLAIAAILLFLKPLPILGVSIYNTIWIILFCYLARFLVLGLRPVISGYHQLDRTLEEAAQIAGARLLRRLRTIILPLVAPAAAAGALLIFLTAFNELTVSALLWSSGSETLGVVFFSFQQGGDSTYAAALGVLTVIVSVALMLSTLLMAGRLPPGVLPWRD